jgi:hypothetical protein
VRDGERERSERVGKREKGRAREREACLIKCDRMTLQPLFPDSCIAIFLFGSSVSVLMPTILPKMSSPSCTRAAVEELEEGIEVRHFWKNAGLLNRECAS